MKRTHGMSSSPEFSVWTDIHTRCYNPKFKDFAYYGGRGITVCARWLTFENFLADMGPRPSAKHSIDRINGDGNYEPGNCRWATAEEQSNNKSNTVHITLDGVTKPLAAWCKERGIKRSTAWLRYKEGVRGEAVFEPRCARLTHNGITDTIAGWGKRTGLKPSTIHMRIKHRGWSVERALSEGVRNAHH